MNIAVSIILILGLLTTLYFIYQYITKISTLVIDIKKAFKELEQPIEIETPKKTNLLPPPCEFRVTIEIVDPITLANKESKLAKVVSNIAPNFITKEVYKKVQDEVALSLQERGIESNVMVVCKG